MQRAALAADEGSATSFALLQADYETSIKFKNRENAALGRALVNAQRQVEALLARANGVAVPSALPCSYSSSSASSKPTSVLRGALLPSNFAVEHELEPGDVLASPLNGGSVDLHACTPEPRAQRDASAVELIQMRDIISSLMLQVKTLFMDAVTASQAADAREAALVAQLSAARALADSYEAAFVVAGMADTVAKARAAATAALLLTGTASTSGNLAPVLVSPIVLAKSALADFDASMQLLARKHAKRDHAVACAHAALATTKPTAIEATKHKVPAETATTLAKPMSTPSFESSAFNLNTLVCEPFDMLRALKSTPTMPEKQSWPATPATPVTPALSVSSIHAAAKAQIPAMGTPPTPNIATKAPSLTLETPSETGPSQCSEGHFPFSDGWSDGYKSPAVPAVLSALTAAIYPSTVASAVVTSRESYTLESFSPTASLSGVSECESAASTPASRVLLAAAPIACTHAHVDACVPLDAHATIEDLLTQLLAREGRLDTLSCDLRASGEALRVDQATAARNLAPTSAMTPKLAPVAAERDEAWALAREQSNGAWAWAQSKQKPAQQAAMRERTVATHATRFDLSSQASVPCLQEPALLLNNANVQPHVLVEAASTLTPETPARSVTPATPASPTTPLLSASSLSTEMPALQAFSQSSKSSATPGQIVLPSNVAAFPNSAYCGIVCTPATPLTPQFSMTLATAIDAALGEDDDRDFVADIHGPSPSRFRRAMQHALSECAKPRVLRACLNATAAPLAVDAALHAEVGKADAVPEPAATASTTDLSSTLHHLRQASLMRMRTTVDQLCDISTTPVLPPAGKIVPATSFLLPLSACAPVPQAFIFRKQDVPALYCASQLGDLCVGKQVASDGTRETTTANLGDTRACVEPISVVDTGVDKTRAAASEKEVHDISAFKPRTGQIFSSCATSRATPTSVAASNLLTPVSAMHKRLDSQAAFLFCLSPDATAAGEAPAAQTPAAAVESPAHVAMATRPSPPIFQGNVADFVVIAKKRALVQPMPIVPNRSARSLSSGARGVSRGGDKPTHVRREASLSQLRPHARIYSARSSAHTTSQQHVATTDNFGMAIAVVQPSFRANSRSPSRGSGSAASEAATRLARRYGSAVASGAKDSLPTSREMPPAFPRRGPRIAVAPSASHLAAAAIPFIAESRSGSRWQR